MEFPIWYNLQCAPAKDGERRSQKSSKSRSNVGIPGKRTGGQQTDPDYHGN